jgi:hypothetical protein
VNRIFLSLAGVSGMLLIGAFLLGLNIGDPTSRDRAVQAAFSYHFFAATLALIFAALVHAIVLTYFMGTGRWMEETCRAYALPGHWREENQRLKSRMTLGMMACFALLIATGATGAAADPASPVEFAGWFGLSGATIHFLLGSTTLAANMLVNFWEYQAIYRNGEIVNAVLAEVRRMREERGLAV